MDVMGHYGFQEQVKEYKGNASCGFRVPATIISVCRASSLFPFVDMRFTGERRKEERQNQQNPVVI